MRLSYSSKLNVESWCCASRAAFDPDSALEAVERHNTGSWALSAGFRYRATSLRRARVLRLCERCLKKRRRCHDSRRPRTFRSWKAYRRHQWAVES